MNHIGNLPLVIELIKPMQRLLFVDLAAQFIFAKVRIAHVAAWSATHDIHSKVVDGGPCGKS
jgi:hypothetical protein